MNRFINEADGILDGNQPDRLCQLPIVEQHVKERGGEVVITGKPNNPRCSDTIITTKSKPELVEPQRRLQPISLFFQHAELISIILSYLNWKEIMKARVVCQKWKEAARITPIAQTYWQHQGYNNEEEPNNPFLQQQSLVAPGLYPPMISELWINNLDFGKALQWISHALPKIPGITIRFDLGVGTVFPIARGEGGGGGNEDNNDDEEETNPERHEEEAEESLDLQVLSNLHDLQNLVLNTIQLRGRYPYLFQFHKLQRLCVSYNPSFQWDLSDLSGVPNLKVLKAFNNAALTGNLKSVRVLRNTLVELRLRGCVLIKGSLHDLADFPLLEELDISNNSSIEGDIRKIGEQDFPSIEELELFGSSVYGETSFDSIEDAPLLMQARYYLLKRNPDVPINPRRYYLSEDSPDRYNNNRGTLQGGGEGGGVPPPQRKSPPPPFFIEFIKAGPRIGWRWTNAMTGGSCEPNWFDPEPTPTPSSSFYNLYLQKLERIQSDVTIYKGYTTSPPTAEQYNQLLQPLGS